MSPSYSQHAREQMAKRNITEADVETTLAHPYYQAVSRSSGNTVIFGHVGGRHLAVVVVPGWHPPHAVTVWEQ